MKLLHLVFVGAVVLALGVVSPGCSGSSSPSPAAPDLTGPSNLERATESELRHSLLGLYTCRVDPDGPRIETLPLRDAMFHLNALKFLEPPPPLRMQLHNLEIDGDKIDVDVELIHPFPGLDRFTGFDVCGIVITSGSITGFSDPDIVIAGEGDTRLVNADGLTRWWNPREFPYNETIPIWGYIDGGMGTPDEIAEFSATLNGYKYFADGLGVDDDLTELDHAGRGTFGAGSAHMRHYTIELDAGLVFNYAIDASWLPPETDPVVVPDSFPDSANREEPYLTLADIAVNSLWYNVSTGAGGGELGLDVHCYDWFEADQNTVRVESPGTFDPVTSSAPVGGDDAHSTYHVDLTNPSLYSLDPVTIWVSVESGEDYEGLLPGKPTAAFMPPFEVGVIEPQGPDIHLEWYPEEVIDHGDRVANNDIEPALIENGDGDLLLGFFWWYQDTPTHWWNRPLYSTSSDNGHSFGWAQQPQWQGHGIHDNPVFCWNAKFTLGSNGQAFFSYGAPCGHTLQAIPPFGEYTETTSHSGPIMEHAGEMLYTAEGYPMMFGDQGGTIVMRRGDIPNVAGTGEWPIFGGTQYTLVAEALLNYLSLSRSTGKTSDGICHLIFFRPGGFPYIKMISSTDISGTNWTQPIAVFEGLAEIWVDAMDPSLWIDDNDGFHTLFAAEDWMGYYHLMYGYSADGQDWSEITSFSEICTVPIEDGLNDTQVVLFDAFDYTWVFICYETGGNVWCRYKMFEGNTFSDPIQVNEHAPAALPDIYPNGDVGVVFAYEADDGTGNDLTDIYYRLAEWVED